MGYYRPFIDLPPFVPSIAGLGAGQHHLGIILTDGSLWPWGWYEKDQLALGQNTNIIGDNLMRWEPPYNQPSWGQEEK